MNLRTASEVELKRRIEEEQKSKQEALATNSELRDQNVEQRDMLARLMEAGVECRERICCLEKQSKEKALAAELAVRRVCVERIKNRAWRHAGEAHRG